MNTLTETTDLVHRHSLVSEKFSNFLRTSAGNSVRYEAVNAMLLNEFLKAHRRIEEQEATIARLQKQIDAVKAGLKKVRAQLEASKPAPQTVLNDFTRTKSDARFGFCPS
jgi:septal ring factor EnvC (AmiA/AmiB activator)